MAVAATEAVAVTATATVAVAEVVAVARPCGSGAVSGCVRYPDEWPARRTIPDSHGL